MNVGWIVHMIRAASMSWVLMCIDRVFVMLMYDIVWHCLMLDSIELEFVVERNCGWLSVMQSLMHVQRPIVNIICSARLAPPIGFFTMCVMEVWTQKVSWHELYRQFLTSLTKYVKYLRTTNHELWLLMCCCSYWDSQPTHHIYT